MRDELHRAGHNATPEGVRAADVDKDLGFERGGVSKMLLATDETAEADLDVRRWRPCERRQEKRFDGEFVAVESGASPGVCNRRPDHAGGWFECLCNVNATWNDLAFGGNQV